MNIIDGYIPTPEDILVLMLEAMSDDRNRQACLLQEYIQAFGPLDERTGAKVRKILGASNA